MASSCKRLRIYSWYLYFSKYLLPNILHIYIYLYMYIYLRIYTSSVVYKATTSTDLRFGLCKLDDAWCLRSSNCTNRSLWNLSLNTRRKKREKKSLLRTSVSDDIVALPRIVWAKQITVTSNAVECQYRKA